MIQAYRRITTQLNEHVKLMCPHQQFRTQSASRTRSSTDGISIQKKAIKWSGVTPYCYKQAQWWNICAYRIIREKSSERPRWMWPIGFQWVKSSPGYWIDVMADHHPRWVANINYAYNDTIVKKATEMASITLMAIVSPITVYQLGLGLGTTSQVSTHPLPSCGY